MITFSISTHNNLHYLKLAVSSVRACAHHKYAPFIIHAENCTDGTNEWLESNAEKYNIKFYIDENQSPRGIGGGMNFCAARVKTKYICFVHSDMVVSSNWDLRLVEYAEENPDTWVDSFRLEPDIWGSPPVRKATFLVERETFGSSICSGILGGSGFIFTHASGRDQICLAWFLISLSFWSARVSFSY